MALWETLRVALGALMTSKGRAILTMLGIIVGIGAVIAVMALGAGAQQAVEEKLASMASADLDLTCMRGRSFMGMPEQFTLQNVRELKRRDDLVKYVSLPPYGGDQPVKYGNRMAMVKVVSNIPDYQHIYGLRLAAGRFFTDADDEALRRVAVIGAEAAKKLGGGRGLIGRSIWYKSTDFTVIGVLEPRGSVGWANPDEQVIIPAGIAERVVGYSRFWQLQIQLVDGADLTTASEDIERIVRHSRHNLYSDRTGFAVRPAFVDIEKMKQETAETFSSLLLSVAAISLLVGGIGVMNIMLVSVSERTREIGVRKALGARRSAILLQFVFEAVLLCLLGGLFGIAAGVSAVHLLAEEFGWIAVIVPESIALAVGFSVTVGLFFGIYPALRASRLDPVEALRSE
jgi:putative ABC transport system permease protein